MAPLYFMLAILGCGEDASACQQVAVAPVHFASQAECLAASGAVLERMTDDRYPTLVAQCQRGDAGPVILRGDQVMLPDAPQARPLQRIASAEPLPRR